LVSPKVQNCCFSREISLGRCVHNAEVEGSTLFRSTFFRDILFSTSFWQNGSRSAKNLTVQLHRAASSVDWRFGSVNSNVGQLESIDHLVKLAAASSGLKDAIDVPAPPFNGATGIAQCSLAAHDAALDCRYA
jgi:hypothetical protein